MQETSPLLKLPGTKGERWALLSQLIQEWYGPKTGDAGYTDAVWKETEKRLGVTIPKALREWYNITGPRDDVWSQQDHLLAPDAIFCEDGTLQFLIENQSATAWGMRIEDLTFDDPPVVTRNEKKEWVQQSANLSEFALHLFAYALQFGKVARIHGFAGPDCSERIQAAFPRLDFPDFIFCGGFFRLFGFQKLIVAIDSTDHVTASGQTNQDLLPFRSVTKDSGFEVFSEDL